MAIIVLNGCSTREDRLRRPVALQCAICHGARGLSQADTPNLAGQYAASIYKELQDLKSGARTNAVMSPQVGNLSDRDM